ncbi:MAG: regulator of sigma protease [Verrucomicrobiota bacterium]|jgi:regulator of sigma E protease|nr:regulator of sigma protease [Verrucomicrobiota bacterium]MDK2963266.1 regulator of sigma protease [Verrucomicrobiota bacterium]
MADSLFHIWTVFYTVFLALFLFGITVFVHEFGHFLVARRCGLIVKTFSIGFGHAVFKWERDGILYKIGWIPFGGYVALPQLDPEGMEKIQGGESGESYPGVSPWKKIAVAVSGPLGNILLAALLAIAVWLMPGNEAGTQLRPIIGNIETNSVAYAAGLRKGDEIIAVNGKPVTNWYDFSVETMLKSSETVVLDVRSTAGERQLIVPVTPNEDGMRTVEGITPAVSCLFGAVTSGGPADRAGVQPGDVALSFNGVPVLDWVQFTELVQAAEPGLPAVLVVERDGEKVELSIVPEYNEEYKRIMVGVQLGGSGMPWMLYKNPVDQLRYDALAIVRVLKALVTPAEARQAAGGLGGPIAIFSMLTMSIKMGLVNTLGLIRFLNVNLAVLNLLPIPVLDGGHIVFALWHGITRRRVNVKVQTALINLFAVLLIGAMLVLSFKDIDRTWRIKDLFGKLLPGQTEQIEDK